MDLNYFLKHHQISLFLAQNAASKRSRVEHRQFALAYASQIDRLSCGYARVCGV